MAGKGKILSNPAGKGGKGSAGSSKIPGDPNRKNLGGS